MPHFDACVQVMGPQIADDAAEIDAVFGDEVKQHPFAAEEMFDIDDFHGEIVPHHEIPRQPQMVMMMLIELGLLRQILHGCDAEDASLISERIIPPARVIDVGQQFVA